MGVLLLGLWHRIFLILYKIDILCWVYWFFFQKFEWTKHKKLILSEVKKNRRIQTRNLFFFHNSSGYYNQKKRGDRVEKCSNKMADEGVNIFAIWENEKPNTNALLFLNQTKKK